MYRPISIIICIIFCFLILNIFINNSILFSSEAVVSGCNTQRALDTQRTAASSARSAPGVLLKRRGGTGATSVEDELKRFRKLNCYKGEIKETYRFK